MIWIQDLRVDVGYGLAWFPWLERWVVQPKLGPLQSDAVLLEDYVLDGVHPSDQTGVVGEAFGGRIHYRRPVTQNVIFRQSVALSSMIKKLHDDLVGSRLELVACARWIHQYVHHFVHKFDQCCVT